MNGNNASGVDACMPVKRRLETMCGCDDDDAVHIAHDVAYTYMRLVTKH